MSEKDNKYIDIPFEIKADSIQEDGTFEGYASVFGGRPDSYGDIITAGAFGETIKKGGRNRNGIVMLWYHDVKQPIGIWKMIVQDEKGLKVIGQLNLDVQRAKEIYSLMKQGAIKGLSIGWDWIRDNKGKIAEGSYEWKDESQRIRLLKNVELWEISPVTFPAKVNANIMKVKSVTDATTERELEEALRESGLSKTEAQYMVKLSKSSLRESEKIDEEINIDNEPEEENEINMKGNYLGILSKLREINTELSVHNMCT
jgi:HK97 family phage prohead protease